MDSKSQGRYYPELISGFWSQYIHRQYDHRSDTYYLNKTYVSVGDNKKAK